MRRVAVVTDTERRRQTPPAMSFSQDFRGVSLNSWKHRDSVTMFDVVYGRMREKIVLQRLIVIGRLPRDAADRTELGAHYENLNFQLKKRYMWDHITGLLLIYPSCLLHVIESSRDILISVLRDLTVMQQQPDCALMEAKIVFMVHNPENRLFQQWSYKVLDAGQIAGDSKGLEEDEGNMETLVCSVLSALQKLSEHLEITRRALPGSAVDETPELIVPLKVLDSLLCRDELQSPQEYLQLYDSPLNVNIEFGQVNPRNFLPDV